jgi:hypothetical protein
MANSSLLTVLSKRSVTHDAIFDYDPLDVSPAIQELALVLSPIRISFLPFRISRSFSKFLCDSQARPHLRAIANFLLDSSKREVLAFTHDQRQHRMMNNIRYRSRNSYIQPDICSCQINPLA